MQRIISFIFIILIVLASSLSMADRGMIPFDPSVTLFEPVQRALIAWNGEEEILLLSTDVKSDKPTTVLEVLPLPSEPKVTKGSLMTFTRAIRTLKMKIDADKSQSLGKSRAGNGDSHSAGKVTFHEKIGAHDVMVAQALSTDGFIKWVENALEKQGAKNGTVPDWMKTEIEKYLANGFTWFVFDIIKVGTKMNTVAPLRYRFKTDRLFFPLRITRVKGGSDVEMLVLTRELLANFPALPNHRITIKNRAVKINAKELVRIDKEIAALLNMPDSVMLRSWLIKGKGGNFRNDLIAY